MKPAAFTYHRAHDVADAVGLLTDLAAAGEDPKLIAGGQSLMPMMNFRLARPSALIDLGPLRRLPSMTALDAEAGTLTLGALVTHHAVETATLPDGFAVLARAMRWVGHLPIRSRGTVAGSLVHGDATAEWCLLALLLDAVVVTEGPAGRREIPADELFHGFYATAVEPDEVVVEVRFTRPAPHAALSEFARRHGDFAIVDAAVALDLAGRAGQRRTRRPRRRGTRPGAGAGGRGGPRGRRRAGPGAVRRRRRRRGRRDRPARRPAGHRRLPPPAHPHARRRRLRPGRGRPPMTTTDLPGVPPDVDPDQPERGERPATAPRFDGRRGRWVGASIPRHEDPRLLTGRGRFIDDIALSGMLHAGFVRATVAHAAITELDLTATREVHGVVAAYDAADLALGDIVAVLDRPAEEFTPTAMPILARGKVRFVGEPLALVVARDPYAVEDGIEAARVSYDAFDAVVSEETALAPGAPAVHEEAPDNVLLDVSMFDTPGVDEAFADAALTVDVTTRSGRQNALPLETRGVVASWDARDDQLLVQTCSQVPHQVRTMLARSLRIAERTVRVTVPDMGGGFGQKCVVGREEIAVAAAAQRLDRPVKWIEDRREALTAGFLAREQRYRTRAAFDADGRITALDVDVVCDMGAYSCYPFTAGIEPLMASAEMPSVYRVPAYRVRGRAITSNKAPTAPYRGVSRPQYVMAIERVMERAARELGLDPVEVRRRNVITEFPYTGVNGVTYDPGTYLESLDLAEATIRDEGWYEAREEAVDRGTGTSASASAASPSAPATGPRPSRSAR